MSERQKSERQKSEFQKSERQKSERQKPAKQKSAKRQAPDPDFYRTQLAEQVMARRALCSVLYFWQFCGHRPCLRAHACALASNECFSRFWPLVPAETKIWILAGMEAKAEGRSAPEVEAAIERALARWRETQEIFASDAAAPPAAAQVPPRPIAAPSPVAPRLRVL